MRKDIIIIAAVVVVIVAGVFAFRIQSSDDYHNSSDSSSQVTQSKTDEASSAEEPSEAGINVTMSIDCKNILDNYDDLDEALRDEKYVPADGIILAEGEYTVTEGETALDLLVEITKANNIPLDYLNAEQSGFGTAYIKGINSIYEFSCGQQSGWTYYLNDEFATVGCSEYELKDGDNIHWEFVCSWD